MEWKLQIQNEFDRAEKSRSQNNEGQARVCARRAAGIAIREYLTRRGRRVPSASAYDLLNLLKEDEHLPADLKLIAGHLTMRVSEQFKLPVEVDLIGEARLLCDRLLSK